MSGILLAFRHAVAMIVFCTGGGLTLFGMAMADLYQQPIWLVCCLVGPPMLYLGRRRERRADIQYLLDRSMVDAK